MYLSAAARDISFIWVQQKNRINTHIFYAAVWSDSRAGGGVMGCGAGEGGTEVQIQLSRIQTKTTKNKRDKNL